MSHCPKILINIVISTGTMGGTIVGQLGQVHSLLTKWAKEKKELYKIPIAREGRMVG